MSIFDLEKAYANWRRGLITSTEFYWMIEESYEFSVMQSELISFGVNLGQSREIQLFSLLFIQQAVDDVPSFVLNYLIGWGY